jgi:hypothetical protein
LWKNNSDSSDALTGTFTEKIIAVSQSRQVAAIRVQKELLQK